jgi:NAD(P)H-dependent flavin oxidoreductase YrpB (nitropropane dioxygenase family)
MDHTHSDQATYEARSRICDLGYLRHAYRKENGKIGWRCPSEPIDDYVSKGGSLEDTVGRKCVCNGLMANIHLGQIQQNGDLEKPLITCGDDVAGIARFLKPGETTYSALDVIEYLLADTDPQPIIKTRVVADPVV